MLKSLSRNVQHLKVLIGKKFPWDPNEIQFYKNFMLKSVPRNASMLNSFPRNKKKKKKKR